MSTKSLTTLVTELQALEKSMQLLQQLRTGQLPLPTLLVRPDLCVPDELQDIDAALSASAPVELDLEGAISRWDAGDQQKYRENLLLPVARLVAEQHRAAAKEVYDMAAKILRMPTDPSVGG